MNEWIGSALIRVWEWVEACHVRHLLTEEDTPDIDLRLHLIAETDATVDTEAEPLLHPLLHPDHALPLLDTKNTILQP